MKGTLTFNYEPWVIQLNTNARLLHVDVGQMVKDEARLWTKQAMNLTPPTRGKLPGGEKHEGRSTSKTALAAGENAVRRDIIRSATPADPDWPESYDVFRKPSLRKIILSGDRDAFLKVIKNFAKLRNWSVADWSDSLHRNSQDNRGRVNSSKKRFIIGSQQLASFWKYLSNQVSHVGRLKAAFGKSFLSLGGKSVPVFVRRHIANAKGECIINTENTVSPSVEVRNFAKGVGSEYMRRICSDTFRARTEAMKRRSALVMSDFSSGMVGKVKAVRSAHGSIED